MEEKAGYRHTKVLKSYQRSFPRFLFVEAEAVEAEAIGVKAVDEIAASTFLVCTLYTICSQF